MSLVANIDHLAIAAGIEAVVVDAGARVYRGDDHWHPVLDGSLDLFKRTEEKSIRLVVGNHTIVVQKEGEETVAVVLPTGHAIAKSLRRMIRRMARKNRGPVPKPKQEVAPLQPQPQPQPQPPASAAQSTPPAGAQPSVPPSTKPAAASEEAGTAAPAPAERDRGDFAGY